MGAAPLYRCVHRPRSRRARVDRCPSAVTSSQLRKSETRHAFPRLAIFDVTERSPDPPTSHYSFCPCCPLSMHSSCRGQQSRCNEYACVCRIREAHTHTHSGLICSTVACPSRVSKKHAIEAAGRQPTVRTSVRCLADEIIIRSLHTRVAAPSLDRHIFPLRWSAHIQNTSPCSPEARLLPDWCVRAGAWIRHKRAPHSSAAHRSTTD